jgi:hypothetical protein
MPCSWEIDNHPSSVSTSNFPVWVLAQLHILYTPPLIVDAKPYYPDGPIDMGIKRPIDFHEPVISFLSELNVVNFVMNCFACKYCLN